MKELQQDVKNFDANRTAQLQSIESTVRSINFSLSISATKSDFDELGNSVRNSLSAIDELAKEIAILTSLSFTSMEERHSRIVEAHCRTFEWIFRTKHLALSDPRSSIALGSWLRSKHGIFWVSGKPGSGKSTFMKWLVQERQTIEALRQWAGSADLITASFYFWISGAPIQKSQQGLFRSLLYEILSQCPELIPTVCPERWALSACSADRLKQTSSWARPELAASLGRLQNSGINKKICFFIDGLDEYDGDHFDIIDILTNLADSSYIKICLSSRPWNCFEDAFGATADRKLYLHDLTRRDIELYARARLGRMEQAAAFEQDTIALNTLISEIVGRAQGVFLWVYLVVRSLRQGMGNGDSVVILQKRLRSLPVDLELYFKHILTSVDPIYKEKVGSMFLAAVEANEPLSLLAYSFIDEEDPDFAIKLNSHSLQAEEIITRHSVMKRRINGRSKGLLEVATTPKEKPSNPQMVSFLHRTVRDFLQLKEINTMLSDMAPESFVASQALARASVAELKSGVLDPKGVTGRVFRLVRMAQKQSGIMDFAVLDELEKVCKSRFRMFLATETMFLEQTIKMDLSWYVDISLKRSSRLRCPSLLMLALTKFLGDKGGTDTTMIRTLLGNGLSPNAQDLSDTPWLLWLRNIHGLHPGREKLWTAIARLLLVNGADAQVAFWPLMGEDFYEEVCASGIEKRSLGDIRDVIALLLGHGLDPNAGNEGGDSIWLSWMKRIYSERRGSRAFRFKITLQITLLFISYGADTSFFTIVDGDIRIVLPSSRGGDMPCYLLSDVFRGLATNELDAAIQLIEREKIYQESREFCPPNPRKRDMHDEAEQAPKRFKNS
jgi:hypothetical protein